MTQSDAVLVANVSACRLQTERETSLRLKGENGIMRKKFNALQKDIEVCNGQIKELYEQKKELYATIASLEKDIASLKREIRERDETIGDKERRIYDLKKKNQVRLGAGGCRAVPGWVAAGAGSCMTAAQGTARVRHWQALVAQALV